MLPVAVRPLKKVSSLKILLTQLIKSLKKLTFNDTKFRKIAQKLKIKIIYKKINPLPVPTFWGIATGRIEVF